MNPDPKAVEAELVGYYDQEADQRSRRSLRAERLEARRRFIDEIHTRPPASAVDTLPLLEIGTGTGRDISALAAAGFTIIGVDLSVAQSRHAQAAGARQVVASVRHLPFRDDSFGAIWTMSTLMHVPNSTIAEALGEVRRVLAPGAIAAVGAWGGPDVENYEDPPDSGTPARLFSRRSDQTWRGLLSRVGTIQEYRTWHQQNDFWYQFALVEKTVPRPLSTRHP